MGFYGNITNTARTQFQFDRIFSSRSVMVENQEADGVYMGRYVLVEYDSDVQLDSLLRVQIGVDGYLYYNPTGEISFTTLLTQAVADEKQIVYTYNEETSPSYAFYIITSKKTIGSTSPAQYRQVVESDSNYVVNYNLDMSTFGEGRGYDSTVWQKVYIDGYEKYIMIAELNSVVPTFDIAADAPAMTPVVPHFDVNSTDVYYKLHQQAPWGFRIAESAQRDNRKTQSNDTTYYPSDEQVSYEKNTYNPKTDTVSKETISYNGAIYFNKAGFDSAIHNPADVGVKDEVSISPSGISGNLYSKHDGSVGTQTAPDIQELRIILPSLGNTLCDIWDKVYGYNKDTKERYRDIAWKDANNREEDASRGGMTRDPETLAGCINITHDLLGMIIANVSTNPPLTEAEYLKGFIYKKDNKYYRIQQSPKYKIVATTLPNRSDYTSSKDYNTAYVEAIETAITNSGYSGTDWYSVKDEKVRRYATNAVSGIGNGWELAYPEGYNYSLVEIEDFAGNLGTVNGLILQLKNLLENDDIETRDNSTVQGAINSLNDMIEAFVNLTDSSGFDSVKVGDKMFSSKDASGVLEVKGDNWVSADIDTSNNSIVFQHGSPFNQNLTTTVRYENNTYSPNFGESFKTPIITYDEKGHIQAISENNIVLPEMSYSENSSSLNNKSKVITDYEVNTDTTTFYSADVGELLLTGYSKTNVSGSDYSILDTDTLLKGLKKVEASTSSVSSSLSSSVNEINEKFSGQSEQIEEINNKINQFTRFVETITLSKSGWSGMTQAVNLTHVLYETDTPHITLKTVSQEAQEEYSKIVYAETANINGTVKLNFVCLEEVPAINLTLQVEVIRI